MRADRKEHEFNLCELEIVLKSGERKTVRVEYHRGHFKNPMSMPKWKKSFVDGTKAPVCGSRRQFAAFALGIETNRNSILLARRRFDGGPMWPA